MRSALYVYSASLWIYLCFRVDFATGGVHYDALELDSAAAAVPNAVQNRMPLPSAKRPTYASPLPAALTPLPRWANFHTVYFILLYSTRGTDAFSLEALSPRAAVVQAAVLVAPPSVP